MTRKRRRLWLLLACGIGLGSATALGLAAFSSSLVFFVTPSSLAANAVPGRSLRLGGLVEQGTVRHLTIAGSPVVHFRVTDGKDSVPVSFTGVLPDLFREGQGVVAIGVLQPDGSFRASDILAKHDETYMPKDVAEALKKNGMWNPSAGPPPPAASWDTLSVKKAAQEKGG
jgi:cytochrome c-type biogenesis protein CcmE